MNRIDTLFKKNKDILSIYFTAGHPTLNSTAEIIRTLVEEGVDMIEIGVPFSDPVADGPVIQQSTYKSLENGMSVKLLFEQLKDIRKTVDIPLLLMGYLNPALQYGIEEFCAKCAEVGIDGAILPDLPLEIYQEEYEAAFNRHGIHNIFLATPQTSDERYIQLDKHSGGFLYMVAASSITGAKTGFQDYQQKYFERIKNLDLKLPRVIGFGISTRETFEHACRYANGAIIGSAFVSALEKDGDMKKNIREFVRTIR
ncbi:MAG: tryptophan synthase subunit alpha [Bacteroidales bacterium]|nr:tryptophan synthase subunit alpha [Bacteroidales bacterium]